MRRREFIAGLGGAVAMPVAAPAQDRESLRRIGVLVSLAADDPEAQRRVTALVQGLQEHGWVDGRNMRVDVRWAAGDTERARRQASDLLSLAPHVIVVSGGGAVGSIIQATRTVPIVFALVPDPVGAGFVASLSRPGGNVTGFTGFAYDLSAKWLELLKEIAPGVTRAAILRDPTLVQGVGQFAVIQAIARTFGVDVIPVSATDAGEIERAITAFAVTPDGGLVVTASASALVHRELIIRLAARHKLPAVYFQDTFVTQGGLISYGVDPIDPHRRAAAYVDRILKGENPSELPVQLPTTYSLRINLKAARAIGLTVSPSLIARADEVIE